MKIYKNLALVILLTFLTNFNKANTEGTVTYLIQPEVKMPTEGEFKKFLKEQELLKDQRIIDKSFIYIADFEAFRAESYYCPAGVKTIGYGTIKYTKGDKITKEEAEKLVRSESLKIYKSLKKSLKVYQTEEQVASLISLCYNISLPSFKRSTLLKAINSKASKDVIKREFLRWVNIRVYVNNKPVKRPLRGLQKRRAKEYEYYTTEV